jgi:hypothetical protein
MFNRLTKKKKMIESLHTTRRFGASGGAAPQKRQGSFASFVPARASVSRRLRQAAGTLHASGRQRNGKTTDLKREYLCALSQK